MNLFLRYMKQKRKTFAFVTICSLIFLICFYLYQLPLEAVLYPMGLCLIVGMICLAYDFGQVRKKYKKLELMKQGTELIAEYLPQAESLEEEAYQQIISLLSEQQQEMQSAMDQKYSDMIGYYTVWVHQIKTPIAAMRLHLQNEDTPLARKLSGDLFRIEQYVEMVLTYLRLDSESSDYVIKEHDLDGIVRSAVKKFSSEFISRRIQLKLDEIHTTIITDEKWLSFVIEQVISNALKYTPSGFVAIYMEEPKTLCIKDTGIGIAAEDVPRIFEKGYTGYTGRMDKKASGIGLYLCRKICENLGHKIWVASEPDKGTIVRIDLEQKKLYVE